MENTVNTDHDVAGNVSWELATNGPPPDYEHFPEVRAGINAKPLPVRVGPRLEVTEEQKTRLYRDGYLVIKHAVPLELTHDARERVHALRASGGTTDFQRGFQFSMRGASPSRSPAEGSSQPRRSASRDS